MPGTAIPAALLAELQRQMNHEYGAAHAYTALAHWCDERNFKGFARFFHKQSSEERVHAQRFADHLLDRGALPELREIAVPKVRFDTLLEVARQARTMEQANTGGIHQAYAAAVKEKDLPAQVALQWFISEQVEEEAWCDEMVDRVEAAGSPGGLIHLDRHIERMLAESSHVEADES
ncbi:MAG: ferritin [Candidatus Eisenbacteria bacterium]